LDPNRIEVGCGCFEVVVDSDRFATTTLGGNPRRGGEVISKEEGGQCL